MPVAVQIDSEELYDVLRSLNIDEKTARRVTKSLVSTRTFEQFHQPEMTIDQRIARHLTMLKWMMAIAIGLLMLLLVATSVIMP